MNKNTQSYHSAPRIETDRLILRAHTLDDIAARGAMVSDADGMRFVGGVQSHEENVGRILRYAGHWRLYGRGPFAVEEKATGALLGEIGVADFQRGLGPRFDGEPEALWVLAAAAHGKGYASEAMKAALDWHDAAFGPRRLVCIIAPDNVASLALAARLGFLVYDDAVFKDHPVRILERFP